MNSDAHSEGRRCPHCQSILSRLELDEVVIHVCDEHGVFFDVGEFEIMRRRAKANEAWRETAKELASEAEGVVQALSSLPITARRRRGQSPFRSMHRVAESSDDVRACPICGEVMKIVPKRGFSTSQATILVDACARHGKWVDRRELSALLARDADGGNALGQREAGRREFLKDWKSNPSSQSASWA